MNLRPLTVLWIVLIAAAGSASAGRDVEPDPARWRSVKLAAIAAFHPAPASVSSSSRARLLGQQYSNLTPVAGSPDRKTVPVAAPDLFGATNAVHDAWAQATVRRDAILVAVVDARGELQSIELESPSGDHRFDDAALEALRRAIAEHPVAEGAARLTRWRVGATRAVRPPRVHPVVPMRTRPTGIVPQMAFKFDETRPGLQPQVPFTDEVKTDVELLSVVVANQSTDGGAP